MCLGHMHDGMALYMCICIYRAISIMDMAHYMQMHILLQSWHSMNCNSQSPPHRGLLLSMICADQANLNEALSALQDALRSVHRTTTTL